jgi:hypothetical protein
MRPHLWTSLVVIVGACGCASGQAEDGAPLGSTVSAFEASNCQALLDGSANATVKASHDGIGGAGNIEAELVDAESSIGMLYAEYIASIDRPDAGVIAGTFVANDRKGSVEGWYEPAGDARTALHLVFSDQSGTLWDGFATASHYIETSDGVVIRPMIEGVAFCHAPAAVPSDAEPDTQPDELSPDVLSAPWPGAEEQPDEDGGTSKRLNDG